MSGHNKWSTIKHKKGRADAARGQIFSRLVKEITVAAREGGGDPEMNARLRTAIDAAKSHNMPAQNIDRAIKRGTGEIAGVSYEEIKYEAYGPGGVAILVEVLTDNRNRAAAEIRHLLSKHNSHLGTPNSVAYIFKAVGEIRVDGSDSDEDALLEMALDAGADDVEAEGDGSFLITTSVGSLYSIRDALESAGIPIESAERTMSPETTVIPDGRQADLALRLLEALEENEDVQAVHTNLQMPD
ncbi:YebC/PmpR family DNA-binding transcriptional regulator [Candidatus Fermentibacterales bacterium]|nr:YebC/PmpR family DNA-binding transcriptional regulator [Candidatus Fermentibacterales bacterium]